MQVSGIDAMEVLDSRGRPTLQVRAITASGVTVSAGVPSGASTGLREPVELRDSDAARYDGAGVLGAAAAVRGPIASMLTGGRHWGSLDEVDAALRAEDGTPDRSRLGSNALVGVSMALARAFAAEAHQPLYRYLAGVAAGGAGERGRGPAARWRERLPVPHFNVLNGGAHAANRLEFQEFMVAPVGAPSMAEAVRAGAGVYAALRRRLAAAGLATGLGDEGGFAPEVSSPRQACELLTAAIGDAGYPAGRHGVLVALDPAANSFFEAPGRYRVDGQTLSPAELVELYAELVEDFPVWSLEDGCAEGDPQGWRMLTERLGEKVQLVGDDVFVTHAETIRQAARDGIGNAALIKVNQAGTVSETLEAVQACRSCGFTAMVSHRSGETPDTFIADLAVGIGCGQLKSGAPARGERVAKYNRLLAIAHTDPDLAFGLPEGALRG